MNQRSKNLKLTEFLRSPTAIVIAALLVRFTLLWMSHHFEDRAHQKFMSWGLEALLIAKSLATGFGFSDPFLHYPFVTAWLAPVYPWLISFAHLIFHLQGHAVVIFAQILNVIFSGLTCYPIYYLGERIFGKVTGLTAAWMWVFLPVAILLPIEWVWDQDLSALLLATLLCFTYFLRESSSPLHWTGYGLLWAVGALTNPTMCILLPFLVVWLWLLRARQHLPSRELFARFALFFVLALTPWTIRNYFEVGGLMFVKSNFGLELWLGNNDQVTGVFKSNLHPMENYREYALLAVTNEKTYNKIKEQQAIAFIRANPKTFAKLCYHRFIDNWAGVYDVILDTYIQPLHLGKAWVWFTGAFSVLTLAGILIALRTNALESFPLIMCVLLFPIPYYITHSSLRYRHPIDPAMTVLVAFVFTWLFSLRRSRPQNARAAQAVETHETEAALV